jgi:hypothetical protein
MSRYLILGLHKFAQLLFKNLKTVSEDAIASNTVFAPHYHLVNQAA